MYFDENQITTHTAGADSRGDETADSNDSSLFCAVSEPSSDVSALVDADDAGDTVVVVESTTIRAGTVRAKVHFFE
jgi:hypothetical protein